MDARTVRQLVVAVLLPAAIVVVDECAFRFGMNANWSTVSLAVIYPLLVGQVAVLGYVVGRADQPAVLRWSVYGWLLVLVNVTMFSVVLSQADYWHSPGHLLGYALLSGQIGLVVIWVTLGSISWAWRLPGGLIVAGVFACLVFRIAVGAGRWHAHVWPTILLSQSLASLLLCVLLRWFGVRIHSTPASQISMSSEASQPIQFSLRNLLAWTAAVNVFLLLVRGLDVLVFLRLRQVELFPTVAIGFSGK